MTLSVVWLLVPDGLSMVQLFQKPVVCWEFHTHTHTHHGVKKTNNKSSKSPFYGWKHLVDEGGQRGMDGLIRADRKATVTQIISAYRISKNAQFCCDYFCKIATARNLLQ